jgi:hypothetical protein
MEKLTDEQVLFWLGKDNRKLFCRIIKDLANGDYTVEELHNDIEEDWSKNHG